MNQPKITIKTSDTSHMSGSDITKALFGKSIDDLAYEIAINKDGEYDCLYENKGKESAV